MTGKDKIGYKKVYSIILGIQLALACSVYWAVQWHGVVYVFWVGLTYACLGGHFSIYPTAAVGSFGLKAGGQLYSVMFSAFPFASLAGFILA